jgi:hypothetical protein
MVKSLWVMVQGDPVFMRRVNGWLAIFWLLMIPVSLISHWVSSVVYVSALSLWALVSGHWSAWQAVRVEVNQDREAEKRDKEDRGGLHRQADDRSLHQGPRRKPDGHRRRALASDPRTPPAYASPVVARVCAVRITCGRRSVSEGCPTATSSVTLR